MPEYVVYLDSGVFVTAESEKEAEEKARQKIINLLHSGEHAEFLIEEESSP